MYAYFGILFSEKPYMIHNVTIKHYKMANKVRISDSKQGKHFTHEFDITITNRYGKVIQNMKKENIKVVVRWNVFLSVPSTSSIQL